MKLHIVQSALAAIAVILLSAAGLAQNVPEQFVVSGKAAEKIQDFTTINLATAERIAEVCEKAAAKQGVQISIMVLDNDGNQVYMDRMDGQGYLNIITADMKARTALMLRAPSKNLHESRDRGSRPGTAVHPARRVCEFRRASHRGQQAVDRRCGRRRFRAASAGVERRDLRAQGARPK